MRKIQKQMSTWFNCPGCGLEVKATKIKLCKSCYDKKRLKKEREKYG